MTATGLVGLENRPGPYRFFLYLRCENRLTQVVSGTLTASYVYDGDGNRVRSVITASGAVTETHYIGQHYEKTVGSGDTKYYYIAGQLVAFERSSGYGVDWGRRFVFRDHLGSTNVIINAASGLLLWRDRYLPFGDVRDTYRKDNNPNFSLQTQYRFTGQRLESRLGTPEGGLDRGLYFYGSRWYDSSLGRFIQADTIVPQPGNPQSLNRYAYVLNNPLKYTDPSGHCIGPLFWLCVIGGGALVVDAGIYYGPNAGGALFGTGPDSRGLRAVNVYRGLIESAAGVQPILVAAGIAVQSQWGGFPQDTVEVRGIPGILGPDTNASLGIASMTASEMQGYGGNALNPADAVQALTQKIQKSVAACIGCSATDQFIVAGMAQNGFAPEAVSSALAAFRQSNGAIAWSDYFAAQRPPRGGGKDAWLGVRSGGRSWNLFQLQLFLNDVLALIAQGWTPPEGVDLGYIQCVVSGAKCD